MYFNLITLWLQYDDGGLHGGYLEGGGGGGGAGLYDPHGNARGVPGLHHSPHLGSMGPAHPQYPPPQPPQHVLAAAAAAAASAVPDVHKRDKDAIYGWVFSLYFSLACIYTYICAGSAKRRRSGETSLSSAITSDGCMRVTWLLNAAYREIMRTFGRRYDDPLICAT